MKNKRNLSIILVILMLVMSLPVNVFADTITGLASVTLGANYKDNGISAWVGDKPDAATNETYVGKSGLQTNPDSSARFIYCNVNDSYIFDGRNKVKITIEYYDSKVNGKGFGILYDSIQTGGANGPYILLKGSNTWETVTFALDDARFADRGKDGSDFRIHTDGPICFGSITVEKVPIVSMLGSTSKLGNIYIDGEIPTINLTFANQLDTSKDLSVSYNVLDYSNSSVKNGGFDVSLNPNITGLVKPITLAPLPKGTYTLSVDAISSDGLTKLHDDIYFSVITDLTGKPIASFLGMDTHFVDTWYSMSWSNIDTMLPLIKQSGATNIRDGQPDNADKALAAGVKMLTGVGLAGFTQASSGTDQYYTDFSNYVKDYATKMKGKAEYFEVGNEYNSGGSAEDYFKFLKLAYAAVKSVDSNMKVVGGVAFQYDATWLKKLVDLGACDYLDAISFHVYTNQNPENEGLVNNFQDLQNYIKSKGITKNIDLLLTETGYATQDSGWGGLLEITSASYAAQLYVTTFVNNKLIDKIFWYDFMNDGTDPTFYETNAGLLRAGFTAKPSFVAFNAASSILAGTTYVKSYNTLDSNIRIYKFYRVADNKDILVLWANKEDQAINLNLGSNQLSVADIFGSIKNYDAINGSVTLTASEQPVYIEGNFTQDPVIGTTPAFKTDITNVTVAPGDDVKINITRSSGAENLSGTYSVDLPIGWQLKSGGNFSSGQTTDILTITASETEDNIRREIRIYPKSALGNLYGILRVQTQMIPSSVVEMSPQVNSAGNGYDIAVKIISQSSNVSLVGGKVTILQPADMVGSATFDTIAPNSTATVKFKAPSLDIYTPTDVKVKIDRNDGSSQVIERNITSFTAVKADNPINIDGVINPNEWKNAMTFTLDKASQVKVIKDWGGPSNLSATAYSKWDANYLYLAVSVTDPIHYNPYTPDLSWQGDGIQFSIDPGRAVGPGIIKGSENNIALNSDTGAVMKTGGLGGNLSDSLVNIKRDGDKTNYEMAIKWSDILPAGITPVSGTDIGFSFLANDNNGKVRRGWIEYMSGIGASKDPNLYGDLILTDKTSLSILKQTPTLFVDVNGHWAKDAIESLSSKHIVEGIGNSRFAPDQNITRAEFVAMMIRMLGINEVPYQGEFTDVKAGEWYANGIETAYKAGIILGDGNNTMRPNDNITREEMTAIAMRGYSKLTTYNEEQINKTLFADDNSISGWAKVDVANATKLGIIIGEPNNLFAPKANATRAEAATVVYRLLDKSGRLL